MFRSGMCLMAESKISPTCNCDTTGETRALGHWALSVREIWAGGKRAKMERAVWD